MAVRGERTVTYLGTQFGGVRSTSQAANRRMGTGLAPAPESEGILLIFSAMAPLSEGCGCRESRRRPN